MKIEFSYRKDLPLLLLASIIVIEGCISSSLKGIAFVFDNYRIRFPKAVEIVDNRKIPFDTLEAHFDPLVRVMIDDEKEIEVRIRKHRFSRIPANSRAISLPCKNTEFQIDYLLYNEADSTIEAIAHNSTNVVDIYFVGYAEADSLQICQVIESLKLVESNNNK